MTIQYIPIDPLVEVLKGKKSLDDISIVNLYNALKNISSTLNSLVSTINSVATLTIEVPHGTIDGSNKTFTLVNKPTGLVIGFKGGTLLKNNTDFKMNDNRIIFTVAPAIASVLQFVYQYGGVL